MAVNAASSHLTEHTLSAFSFAFHTNFAMRVCVCLHICMYTGALLSMHVLAEARGGIWGPRFTTPYCIETGSLTEPGARLVITKPQLSSSLGPARGSQNLTFYLGAGYPLCDPHAWLSKPLTR